MQKTMAVPLGNHSIVESHGLHFPVSVDDKEALGKTHYASFLIYKKSALRVGSAQYAP